MNGWQEICISQQEIHVNIKALLKESKILISSSSLCHEGLHGGGGGSGIHYS